MKHIILTLILALASAVGAQAQSKFYEACKGQEDFETVYIGKAMLQMVKGQKMKVKGMDLNTVVDKIDAIMIVSTESKSEKLKKLASGFSTSNGYELLVDVAEKDDNVTILYRKNYKKLNEYVLKINENRDKDMTVIIITGTLTPEDIIKIKYQK